MLLEFIYHLLQSVFGAVLDREKAIKLYKEIIIECRLGLASVSLIPPITDGTGYQLSLSILSGYDKELLQKIVGSYHLSWKELSDRIIIYESII
jgi:hypothetical protein